MRHQDHPLYNTWQSMRARCNNPNNPAYHDYGGRGVFVCDEWNDFWQFVEDMGPKPTPQHTLDKDIIKAGNLVYCKEFCCWATKAEQASNKRPYKPWKSECSYIYPYFRGCYRVQVHVIPKKRTTIYRRTLEEAKEVRDQLVYERDFYRFVGLY